MPWQQVHHKQKMSLSIALVLRNLCTKYEVKMGCYCLNPERVKMGQGSRWASVIYPLKESKWERFKMGCCCLPPDRVRLTVNSKKETNSRVTVGQESKWAKARDGFLLFTLWKSQDGLPLFTPWTSQNGPRVKVGFCYLHPERVKMGKVQDGLLLFTSWQSQTNSEEQERNKQQGQNEPRVKMGSVIYSLKESKWAVVVYPQNGPRVKMGFCYLPPERVKMGCCCLSSDRVKLTVKSKKETNSRVKMGQEPKWAKGQDGLLLFTPWKSQNRLLLFTLWQSQTNSEQQERNKQQGQNGPTVKMGLCFLPPERVKMIQVSRWAGVIYPLKESN